MAGGATVVLLLSTPDCGEHLENIESVPPVPVAGTGAQAGALGGYPSTGVDPVDDVIVDDFTLWERELADGGHLGCEHDQRALRALARWEREKRRRRRGCEE